MTVKIKKTLNWYVKYRLFYLYLILLFTYLIFIGSSLFYYGFNRTIGWKWILTSIDFIITYYTLGVYFLGLLILFTLRRKTNLIISKTFLIGLFLIFLWDTFYGMNFLVVGYFKIFIFLLFLFLIVLSKSYK